MALAVAIAAALEFSQSAASSCPLDLSPPSNHFDGVNERGFLSYWEQIGSLDLSQGAEDLAIPITLNFRSDRGTNSSSDYLGSGFQLFPFQSVVYQLDERNFVQVEPSGGNRYFHRTKPEDTILKDRGGWAAAIDQANETVTIWPECGGSKMVYTRGRISSLTIGLRKFDFVYSGNIVSEIREAGHTVLKVIQDRATGRVQALEFSGKRIVIDFDKRPIVENVNGQNLVGATVPALRRLEGALTGTREYQFGVNEKLLPTLKISGSPEREFVWDPQSKYILADTGINYSVQPGEGKGLAENAAITRRYSDGGTEFWHFDRRKGLETSQGRDGVTKVTTYFTSGILAGKLRRVEEIAAGKTRTIRDLSYNEDGLLARETDPDGIVTIFKRDDHSRLTDIMRDGQPFAHRAYDDKNRVKEEEVYGGDKITYRYLADGGFETTTLTSNGETVKSLYDKAEKLIDGVFSDKSGLVLNSEAVHAIIPATSEKRETLINELTDNLSQLKDPIARGNLLIRIGRLYTDDTLGPSDPHSAIKVFESILLDPTMDTYSKAQAYSWITSKYIEIGRSEWPKGVKQMEQLLALKGDGLPPERLKKFRSEQTEAFRMMLALMRTGQPKKDEEIWRATMSKYGASEELKKQFDYLLAEQKNQLSSQYFNNN